MNMHPRDMSEREAPGNIEAEQALLGALLINNKAFDVVAGTLEPEYFFDPLHSKIFDIAARQIRKGMRADPVTIKTYLPEHDAVGSMTLAQYLARLASEAVNIVNAADYARGIQIAYLRRELISLGDKMCDAGFDLAEPVEILEQIDALQTRLNETVVGLTGREDRSGGDIANEYYAAISKDVEAQGVPLCLPEIGTVLSDNVLRPKRLYGLLSSSGEGKTSLTLQIMRYALLQANPVLFLSYDQNWHECIAQMAAQETGIEFRRQMQGDLNDDEREQCLKFSMDMGSLPFEVIDCTNETAAKLSSYSKTWLKRKTKGNNNTPLIVIDHIGSIESESERADEGTKARKIGQALKALAKSTNSVVLALQQRSSTGMKRPNPRPTVHDLWGGQPALQPFDGIFFLFRAEKFRKEQLAIASTEKEIEAIDKRFPLSVWEGRAEIGTLKVRFGDASIRRKIEWEGRFTRYRSLQDTAQDELPI